MLMGKKITKGKDGKLYYGKGTQGGLAPQPPQLSNIASPQSSVPRVEENKIGQVNQPKRTKLQQEMYTYLKETKAAQSPKTQAILDILVSHKNGIHRCCLREELRNQGIDVGQPAAHIRDLRNAGVNIPKQSLSVCPVHNKSETLDKIFTPYITGDSYARAKYTTEEIFAIRAIIGNQDAFTKRPTTNIEIDHRIPVSRMRVSELLEEEKVDISNPEAVKERYQPLTRDNNLYKSRVCEKCVETNVKPSVFLGLTISKKEFGGGEPFEEKTNGCGTCPYAHPENFFDFVNNALK
jgi:hypothetical protein